MTNMDGLILLLIEKDIVALSKCNKDNFRVKLLGPSQTKLSDLPK